MAEVFLALSALSAAALGGASAVTVGLANLYGLASTALGGILLNLGFSLGLSLLVAALRPGPEASEIQQIVRSTVSSRLVHLGRVKTSGTLVFLETIRGSLHGVCAAGHGLHDGVEAVYIDDNHVSINLNGGGNVTSAPYARDDPKSRILWRLGNVPETHFGELTTEFPVWTSAHRGDGMFTFYYTQWAVGEEWQAEVFPSLAFTNYSFVVRGRKNYSWAAPQDINNEATWTWSDNLARCVLWYMMHADGARMPIDMLTTPLAIAGHQKAIADCAEQVPLNDGGSEDRYRYSGTYSMEERPADVLPRIMVNGLTQLELTSDGGLTIRVAKWQEPTVTITKEHVRSVENIQPGRSILDTANRIRAKWYSADHDYQTIDMDPWENAADISARGVIDTDISLAGTPSHTQARRVAKIYASKVAPDWVFTINCDLSACAAIGEPFFNFEYTFGSLDIACAAEIQDARIILDDTATVMGFQIQAISANPAAYDWNPATEEGTKPLSDDSLGDNTLDVPSNFDTEIDYESLGGVSYPYVKMSMDRPSQASLRLNFEYRRPGDPSWTVIGNSDNSDQVRTPILGDGDYQFRANFLTVTRRPGPYTSVRTETIVGNPTAPSNLLAFTASGGNGAVTFGWTAPNDTNVARVVVYLTQAGGTLDKNTDVHFTYFTGPNAVMSGYVQGVPAGNILTNPNCTTDTDYTKGAGWAWNAGGYYERAATGSTTDLSQTIPTMSPGQVLRCSTTSTLSAGTLRQRLTGVSNVVGANVLSASGTLLNSITAAAAHTSLSVARADTAFAGTSDNHIAFIQVAGMAPQGFWDIRAFTANGSGLESASPILVTNVRIV